MRRSYQGAFFPQVVVQFCCSPQGSGRISYQTDLTILGIGVGSWIGTVVFNQSPVSSRYPYRVDAQASPVKLNGETLLGPREARVLDVKGKF